MKIKTAVWVLALAFTFFYKCSGSLFNGTNYLLLLKFVSLTMVLSFFLINLKDLVSSFGKLFGISIKIVLLALLVSIPLHILASLQFKDGLMGAFVSISQSLPRVINDMILSISMSIPVALFASMISFLILRNSKSNID